MLGPDAIAVNGRCLVPTPSLWPLAMVAVSELMQVLKIRRHASQRRSPAARSHAPVLQHLQCMQQYLCDWKRFLHDSRRLQDVVNRREHQ